MARTPKRASAENGAEDSRPLGERVWGNPGRVFGGFPRARSRESGARAPHWGAHCEGRTHMMCRAMICSVGAINIIIVCDNDGRLSQGEDIAWRIMCVRGGLCRGRSHGGCNPPRGGGRGRWRQTLQRRGTGFGVGERSLPQAPKHAPD